MTRFHKTIALTVIATGIFFGAAARAASPAAPALSGASPLLQKVFLGFGEKQQQAAAPQEYYIHDDATFDKDTKTFGIMPFGRADLEYEIQLPKDWTQEDLIQNSTTESAETLLGDIARYESPMIGTNQARIRIQAVKLQYEIDAASWLENYMLANGYSIEGNVQSSGTRSATGTYVSLQDNVTSYVYIATRISGSYALVARFEEPRVLKDYMSYIQKKTIDSFHILYPREDPVENQRAFTLVDALKLSYPESWIITSNQVHDMSHMSMDLQNKSMSGKVEGYVRFAAIRRSPNTDIMAAIAEQKKFFSDVMGLKFVKLLKTEKAPVYERFMFNREEDYEVVSTKSSNIRPQEVQFVMLGDKEFYIFGFLFTQEKDSNLSNWARNTQSFRVMLQSIK